MATDLKSVLSQTNQITSLSNLVFVNPQSNVGYYQQAQPVPPGAQEQQQNVTGFLFDYEGENAVTLESDITDHYVENNSTISDQIAIRPVTVTVQGFVGELNDIFPLYDTLLKTIQSKLQTLSAYSPELSTKALLALNDVVLAAQVATKTAENLQQTYGAISRSQQRALNKQQKAFYTFYQAFTKRTLFTVQTPWAIFNNMAIKSLRAIQGADTRMITDFEVQFKKIYYVGGTVLNAEQQERAKAQNAGTVDLGTKTATESGLSFSSVYNQMVG